MLHTFKKSKVPKVNIVIPPSIDELYSIIKSHTNTYAKPSLEQTKPNYLIFDKLRTVNKITKKTLEKYTTQPIDEIFEIIHAAAFMPADVLDSFNKHDMYVYSAPPYINKIYTFDSSINVQQMSNVTTLVVDALNTFFRKTNTAKFDLILYESPCTKQFPEHGTVFTPANVNSGQTSNSKIISLFRSEENIKVLIHEIVHKYSFDNGPTSVKHTYNISRPYLLLNEAIAETLAIIINSILHAIHTNTSISTVLSNETSFGIMQSAKILAHFDFDSVDDFLVSGNKQIIQETSAFEYHIIKTIFLLNLQAFMDNMNDNRKLMSIIDDALHDRTYQSHIDSAMMIIYPGILQSTFRMSLHDAYGMTGGSIYKHKYNKYKSKYLKMKGGSFEKYRSIKIYTSVDDPNYLVFVNVFKEPSTKLALFERNMRVFINDDLIRPDFLVEVYDYEDILVYSGDYFDSESLQNILDVVDGLESRKNDKERRDGQDMYE